MVTFPPASSIFWTKFGFLMGKKKILFRIYDFWDFYHVGIKVSAFLIMTVKSNLFANIN